MSVKFEIPIEIWLRSWQIATILIATDLTYLKQRVAHPAQNGDL
jgi:hypothetical protein